MVAERRSGYLAIAASMFARRSSGTGVLGSGMSAGSLVRSTDSSQPGTREPWAKRGTCPLVTRCPKLIRPSPRAREFRASETRKGGRAATSTSSVDPAEDRVEHGQRGDEVGDV